MDPEIEQGLVSLFEELLTRMSATDIVLNDHGSPHVIITCPLAGGAIKDVTVAEVQAVLDAVVAAQ
jgi:hypothetical protein